MFDTRTETFKEWALPTPNTMPYTASAPDKNGRVCLSSNMIERVVRVDPKTGEVVEYVIPTPFDAKKILHDPTTDRVVLWMNNKRTARMTRVEPLD